jgi:ribonuclease P protein component
LATFRKHEHLKSAKLISDLVTKGRSYTSAPVKLVWKQSLLNTKAPAQVAFSVPKRNFPKAVDRNRIKRQLRECYREHKNKLYDFLNSSGKQYALMIVYTGKKAEPFAELMLKFTLTLQHLEKDIEKRSKRDHDRAD